MMKFNGAWCVVVYFIFHFVLIFSLLRSEFPLYIFPTAKFDVLCPLDKCELEGDSIYFYVSIVYYAHVEC
jgi:hypothetical protein